jgi:hypothetical protein
MKQNAPFHLEKLGKDKLPAAAPIDYTRMISLASCFSLINPNPTSSLDMVMGEVSLIRI